MSIMLALEFPVLSTAQPAEKVETSYTYVNPLYADIISEEDIENEVSGEKNHSTLFSGTPVYVETVEEAAEILKPQLADRKAQAVVHIRMGAYNAEEAKARAAEIFHKALEHTGDPIYGDYLKWHHGGYDAHISGYTYEDYCELTVTYNMVYYTTAAQEAELDAEVDRILESLDIEGKNDYLKVKAIYDYICANVTYDNTNLNNNAYTLKFSAYAAAINKTAVCQGYALLFYRLSLEEGIDARLIAGLGDGGNHGWNIVKLGNYYYNLDSTWDAGQSEYDYFLLNESNFVKHERFDEYDTAAFHAEYPMGASDYVYDSSLDDVTGGSNLVASGYCGGEGDGTNLEWSLDKDGVLTISGTGAMADYSYVYAPWFDHSTKIKTIVFEEGITSISNYAFYSLSGITGDLIIPDTVVSIGDSAFYNCSGFNGKLVLSNRLESIGKMAFAKCGGFKGDLVIPNSVIYLGEEAFKYCLGFDGELVIGNSVEAIYDYTFDQCTGFTGDLVIPDSVTTIGENAFHMCEGFTGSLYIGNGVTDIGQYAFSNCRGFKGNLILGESLNIIGGEAFYGCIGFKGDLIIPNSVTVICDRAFRNCKGFEGKLVMSKNIESIDYDAFYYCTALSGSVTFPESLGNIGNQAFYKCGIDEFYFEGNAPAVFVAEDTYPSFDADTDSIYYPFGNPTWEIVDGKWKGYNAVPYNTVIYGDISGDGKVDVQDAYLARLFAAKLQTPTEEEKLAADVDGDGKVTAVDANYIRKFAVEIIDSFPIEA